MKTVKEHKTLNFSEILLCAIILNPVVNSWADTKRLIQAGCHDRNQMDGLRTVEDDIYPKKQRTDGAFDEASSVRLGFCSYLYCGA